MAAGARPPTQKPIRGCQTFTDRGLPTHLAVYAIGVALWIGIYAAVALSIGTPRLIAAESPSGLFLRQSAVGFAGAIAGLYFAGAYTRALGAPLPNLVAASAVSALMPARVLAFGSSPPSPALVGSDLLVSVLALSAGSGVTIPAVIGWYCVRFGGTGTAEAERWESDSFPPGFRLAVSATESGTIDWDRAEYGLAEWSYRRFFRNGAVVLVGGLLLYGGVLAGRTVVGDLFVLQLLEETPWILLALAGAAHVWWLNHHWRTKRRERLSEGPH